MNRSYPPPWACLPVGMEKVRVESIFSSDAEPIDTLAGYDILYLFLKYGQNSIGNFKFEGRV